MVEGGADAAGKPPVRAVDFDAPAVGHRDWVLGILRQLEAEVHEGGWDKSPQLWGIVEHSRETKGPRLEALAATEPWMWRMPGLDYRGCLEFHARFLAGWSGAPIHVQVMRELAADRLAAVALIIEAWGMAGPPGEREKYRSIADNPAGYEIRTGIAVGTDSTVYLINRRRGRAPNGLWFHPPTLEEARFGEHDDEAGNMLFGGVTANLLRAIVNAVNVAAGVPAVAYQFGSSDERRYLEQVKGGPL